MNLRKICTSAMAALSFVALGTASAQVWVDGTQIPYSEIQSITVNLADREIVINTGGNYEVQPTDGGGGGGDTPTVNISANKSIVYTGGTAAISWSYANVSSCVGTQSSGSSAWTSASFGSTSGSVTIDGNYIGQRTYTLTCKDTLNNDVKDSVSIEGREPQVSNCGPVPAGITVKSWSNLVWGSSGSGDFPGLQGTYATVKQGPDEIVAIEFNTFTAKAVNARIGRIDNADGGAEGARDMSISECPGDFSGGSLVGRCVAEDIITARALWWEVDGAYNEPSTCKLEQGTSGKTYYLNIRYPYGCRDNSSCASLLSTKYYR